MPRHNALVWPILELIDAELSDIFEEAAEPPQPIPVPADTLYMAGCDVFLTRDGASTFTLTLKHRGQVSEIRLLAELDETGAPSLLALVA